MPQEVTSCRTSWRRFFAFWIDNIVVSVVWVLIILATAYGELSHAVDDSKSFIIGLLIIHSSFQYFYYIWMTGKFGQTIGKMVMGITVLDLETDKHISYRSAFYRYIPFIVISTINLIYIIITKDIWAYGPPFFSSTKAASTWKVVMVCISLVWMLVELVIMVADSNRQSIHDRMAGSVVVKQVKMTKPEDIPA